MSVYYERMGGIYVLERTLCNVHGVDVDTDMLLLYVIFKGESRLNSSVYVCVSL